MRGTPFDKHAQRANAEGFHNHRVNTHSDLISYGIMEDVYAVCPALRQDLDSGRVGFWTNRRNPWGRERNTDLIVAAPLAVKKGHIVTLTPAPRDLGIRGGALGEAEPDPSDVRIVGEHKSIVTAHRNRSARHDDLNNLCQEAAKNGSAAVLCATVMVGVAEWYLNVADKAKDQFLKWTFDPETGRRTRTFDDVRFQREFLSRLRAHDETLMDDFIAAMSENTPRDIEASFALFNTLPRRSGRPSSGAGYDGFLLVPVHYDNVHPARVSRDSAFGAHFDAEYAAFVDGIAQAYHAEFARRETPPPESYASIARTPRAISGIEY